MLICSFTLTRSKLEPIVLVQSEKNFLSEKTMSSYPQIQLYNFVIPRHVSTQPQ